MLFDSYSLGLREGKVIICLIKFGDFQGRGWERKSVYEGSVGLEERGDHYKEKQML